MKTTQVRKVWLFVGLVCIVVVYIAQTDRFDSRPLISTPPTNAIYLDHTQPIEVRVADLLSYMTFEEKIGQMTLVEKSSLKEPGHISTYHLGAMLSGSGAKPVENSAAGWKEMIDTYQAEAQQSRLGIPLLYGADAIHGHAHVLGATVFPHAIGLGASGNPELVEAVANATAQELAATGVNWNFAPNLDQPQDIRWGRVYEAFSDDSALVSTLGAAYLKGLQTNTDREDGNIFILGTLKHYAGIGGMKWGTSLNQNFKIDQGRTVADETQLRAAYLPPFVQAMEAGALSIMVGLHTWGNDRMVRQNELLTEALKQELAFKGFLVSDWYGVHEGKRNKFLATVQAVNAGIDMVMLPFDYEQFTRHMKWANRLGLISDERINDAAGRILYTKFALGLFDNEREAVSPAAVGDLVHRALARESVAQSLVLLKNEENILPLSANAPHIRVAGSAADNVGMQLGGWSIEWQGVDGNWPDGSTSILAGIKTRVNSRTMVEYDQLGNFATSDRKAPLGIAIVGEKPYAEGWGDKAYPTLSEADLLAIKNLQANADKIVVVIVSGRPLLIENEIGSIDALVAAWLPGSEGQGVADVLFGDKPFVGTLPLPWPRTSEQLPISTAGVTADGTAVLFPRYFGLN